MELMRDLWKHGGFRDQPRTDDDLSVGYTVREQF